MPNLIDRLPPPAPDVASLRAVLKNEEPRRIPLFELGIADGVLAAFKGAPLHPRPATLDSAEMLPWARDRVELWHRLGFDYFLVRADTTFSLERFADPANADRAWIDEHRGVISSLAEVDQYDWPDTKNIQLASARAAGSCLPENMGLVAFSGGVLEWATILMGLEQFMFGLYDGPELVKRVVDRVGQAIYDTFAAFCGEEQVVALYIGDDFGYKNGTLIHPDQIRELILPWHQRYVELAHGAGLPFVLHSCGNIEAIMPDLIETVGIDARHSFEDAITPVEQANRIWGDKVAILGGVDVDILSRGTAGEIRKRTEGCLRACAPGGGYAAGSGNSVPDYIPAENYLEFLLTVDRFRRG